MLSLASSSVNSLSEGSRDCFSNQRLNSAGSCNCLAFLHGRFLQRQTEGKHKRCCRDQKSNSGRLLRSHHQSRGPRAAAGSCSAVQSQGPPPGLIWWSLLSIFNSGAFNLFQTASAAPVVRLPVFSLLVGQCFYNHRFHYSFILKCYFNFFAVFLKKKKKATNQSVSNLRLVPVWLWDFAVCQIWEEIHHCNFQDTAASKHSVGVFIRPDQAKDT